MVQPAIWQPDTISRETRGFDGLCFVGVLHVLFVSGVVGHKSIFFRDRECVGTTLRCFFIHVRSRNRERETSKAHVNVCCMF